MRWALDKRLTHELADRMRVERPLTWYPASSADLACIDAAFPVILKPSVKDNENGFTRAKAWRVENRRELGRRYEEACRLVPRDHIMVQELIPGGGEAQFSFAALCSEGEVLSSLTARRTRQYPVEFGHSSSFVETVDRPEVAEAARRLLTDIRYSGLIEVEFKYDSRTGAFKLLDMNPRIWTWSAIGRKAGVDFPYLMWRHLCNEPIAELAGRAGVRWVRMSTDVLAAWPRILAGKLSLASYMGTFRGPLQFALASADDPVPALISLPYRMTAAAMRFLFRGARNDTNPPAAARLVEPRTRRNTAPHVVPGAVVLGGDYQGLGIVRSLGRHGIPVCVIDNEPSISRYSRYTTHWVRAPDLFDATRTVESVLDAGRRFGLQGWVLYPTRDEIVAAFSRYRGDLEKVFRVPTPGWETVRVAWDKRLTYRLAENLGIATPRTQFARDVAELALREVEFPVVLKPAIKEHFIYATKLKAIRADNRNELACLFRRACEVIPAEEVMLQELIPGGGECQYSYCALFKDGRPLAKMVVRRVRQHPPDFGRASTFVRTEDIGEIEEPSERFLAACGYYGLVEVEYKYDARDGRFKLLDVNPRTWGYHSIGTRAGVDFPYLLFRDQLGLQVEECRAETGIRWIRLMTDVPTSLAEMLRGRMTLGAFTRSLTSFDTEAVFAKDDMRPALAEVAALPYLYRTRQAKDWGRGSS
jgi:predicted ATP-grasp superfamily ATP-dependent carboligase